MQRLVNFAQTQQEPAALASGKLSFSGRKDLHGIKALTYDYEACLVLHKDSKLQSLERIVMLKTYSWALPKVQADWVLSLIPL